MPSYDYNRDTSPRDDDENSNIPDEISDHPVSPLEGMSTGIGDGIERRITGAVDIGISVVGSGLHVAGKIFRGLFG